MLDKLDRLEEEYRELEALLSDPEVLKDKGRYQSLSRRYAEMGEVIGLIREYRKVLEDLEQAESLLDDPELKEMAKAEREALLARKEALEKELERHLLPKDPMDERDAIVEIRAGTGGEEAALFARDLFNMYLRFAEEMGFETEVLDSHPTDLGGFSKVVFEVRARGLRHLQVRERGPPGATGARHRDPGADPHLHRHGGRPPQGGGGGLRPQHGRDPH